MKRLKINLLVSLCVFGFAAVLSAGAQGVVTTNAFGTIDFGWAPVPARPIQLIESENPILDSLPFAEENDSARLRPASAATTYSFMGSPSFLAPEPTTLALTAIGGTIVFLLRRKKV